MQRIAIVGTSGSGTSSPTAGRRRGGAPALPPGGPSLAQRRPQTGGAL